MINEEDAAKHAGLLAEQRFYLVERLARARLAEAREAVKGPNEWPVFDDFDYMIEVLAAAEAFGIDELSGWLIPQGSDARDQDECRSFRAHATKVSQRLMFKCAGVPNPDPNSVAFDSATREKLRFHLGKVRSIIDADPMPDWKKQDLYDAIAALEREIDKSRTRVAAVIDVLAKLWEGEVRAVDAVRQIVMIVQEARSKEQEKARLATPAETRQIEAQKKMLPAPASKPKRIGRKKDADDEIPF